MSLQPYLYSNDLVSFAWETAELSWFQQMLRRINIFLVAYESGIFGHQKSDNILHSDINSPLSHKIVNKYCNSKPAQSFSLYLKNDC